MMRFTLAILALVVVAQAAKLQLSTVYVEQPVRRPNDTYDLTSLVTAVNSQKTSWTAGINTRFHNAPHKFVVRQANGVLKGGPQLPVKDVVVPEDLPSEFDGRTQWGSMCPSLNEVRDQADCEL